MSTSQPGRFNLRTAAVIQHEGYLLVHQVAGDNFWALPGGRPEIHEPSDVALARELREELGVTVAVGPLLWMAETFFTIDETRVTEVCFYYACELPADCRWLDRTREHRGIEAVPDLRFRWLTIATLDQERLFPTFLRDGLLALPVSPVHIIHWDADDLATGPRPDKGLAVEPSGE